MSNRARASWVRRDDDRPPASGTEAVVAVLDADGKIHPEFPAAPHEDLWLALCEGRALIVERGQGAERHHVVVGTVRETQRLTWLEREAVQYAALGYSNKAIAYTVGVTAPAVSAAVGRAAAKLGFSSRTSLVRIAARLLHDPAPRVDEQVLTAAEREVLDLVRRGYSNRDIAQARCRSDRTVANQIASILGKTKSSGRRSLVARG